MKSKLLGIKLLKQYDALEAQNLRALMLESPVGLQEILDIVVHYDLRGKDQLMSWDDDGYPNTFNRIGLVLGVLSNPSEPVAHCSPLLLKKAGWTHLKSYEEFETWVFKSALGEFAYNFCTSLVYTPAVIFYVRRG